MWGLSRPISAYSYANLVRSPTARTESPIRSRTTTFLLSLKGVVPFGHTVNPITAISHDGCWFCTRLPLFLHAYVCTHSITAPHGEHERIRVGQMHCVASPCFKQCRVYTSGSAIAFPCTTAADCRLSRSAIPTPLCITRPASSYTSSPAPTAPCPHMVARSPDILPLFKTSSAFYLIPRVS